MKTNTWVKPSGQEITINDRPENIKYAKKLGWKLKEEGQDEKPQPEKQAPAPNAKRKGVNIAIPEGTGTTLYKRLKGEIVEGQESPEEIIIESDLFPNELVAKKLQDGWYKTKEKAGEATPDKPKGS